MRHVIALLVVPDAVAFEVAIAQQIFGPRMPSLAAAIGDENPRYEVVLCGEQPRQRLSSGADLGELAPLETMLTADTVMVPGVEQPLAPRGAALLDNLRGAHGAGARMVSFCGGAFVLGAAGILDGRRATTHWVLSAEFRHAFPLARLEVDKLYVDDGPVHTSGGMFSIVDLSLHLLALDLGQAYANDVGRLLVSPPRRQGGQAQFIKESLRVDAEPQLGPLLRWIREHLDEPLTLARLAARHHVSERSLVRRFREDTGTSVLEWITRERVDRAKVLLETTDHRVSEVAAMVGFGSSETLRRNFEKLAGTTATAYRATFRTTTADSARQTVR
ncbi:GlxA family transcriptional regulator [Pseudonocardia spinosispora]|uniref:GlxA family transcriptional regulator n=1 Tax=Pseudonocardia spinosispora TaxID=103441 RepID=UPI00040C64B1|nr:helix-turn-helix domain-containing protein [Pseudonocardia spinosispora]